MAQPGSVVIFICLVLNIASSILIVLLNKWIYTKYGFPNMTLTCIHFLLTFCGLVICLLFRMFELKRPPLLQMIPLSLTFCGFVVFTNLSLQSNTVGTYQLIKMLTMPIIMIIETYFYKKTYSRRIKLVVIPIFLGVFLNSWYDVKFNLIGIIYAGIGVAVTSLYQVWVDQKQKEFEVNSMQLLFYQAPLSAFMLLFIIPVFEPASTTLLKIWPRDAILMVFFSGVVAFSVNLSIYWIIGNTSPVTYNVVGHLKFCLVLVGGFMLFQEKLNALQALGIAVTLTGVIAYTHFKMQDNKPHSLPVTNQEAHPTSSKNTESG
ncbi:hypothetical protein CHS0354_001870 [Potamilus streckersoni]|uniref:Sugar phosphate transporter domain-containing protein n=1 Tax=Potamilus streckersoni TaxID=2493646 RepID=A0AAE0WDF3_9BIVA|nr:hypothetical protein CHS0354_001870 [Potamilus streckersoni]